MRSPALQGVIAFCSDYCRCAQNILMADGTSVTPAQRGALENASAVRHDWRKRCVELERSRAGLDAAE
jgi:hypothetical protein